MAASASAPDRYSFASLDEKLELPDLIAVQRTSFEWLLAEAEIEVDGDSARARCYVHAQHTKAGTPGGDNYTIGGIYVDAIVRTEAGWRTKGRQACRQLRQARRRTRQADRWKTFWWQARWWKTWRRQACMGWAAS